MFLPVHFQSFVKTVLKLISSPLNKKILNCNDKFCVIKKKTEYTQLLKFIFLDSSTLFSLTGHVLNNKLL